MDRHHGASSLLCTASRTLIERQEKQDQSICKTAVQRVRSLMGWLLEHDGGRLIIGAGGPRWSRAE